MEETLITHTVGAVLAGGSSSRMGKDKAALMINGETFLDRVVGVMSSVISEVAVYGGSYVPMDGVLLQDDEPGQGPVGGLLTAMKRSRGRPVLVISVDTPMVTAEVIRSLIEPEVPPDAVRIAVTSDRAHPLVGVYGHDVLPLVQERFDAGRRSVLGVIDHVKQVVEVVVDPDAVFNVNTEADYQALIERYGL